jgi:methyl-accepting chemotaxis protein
MERIMPVKAVKRNTKSNGAHNGNGAHSNGNRDLLNGRQQSQDAEMQIVSQEIARLVDASKEGRLSERGRTDKLTGIHSEMVLGINEMLDAILLPIGEGNRILAQISGGKVDELIAHTYRGDHEKMKLAVNNVGIVLQGLQKELARLVEASREGQLSDRGNPYSSA